MYIKVLFLYNTWCVSHEQINFLPFKNGSNWQPLLIQFNKGTTILWWNVTANKTSLQMCIYITLMCLIHQFHLCLMRESTVWMQTFNNETAESLLQWSLNNEIDCGSEDGEKKKQPKNKAIQYQGSSCLFKAINMSVKRVDMLKHSTNKIRTMSTKQTSRHLPETWLSHVCRNGKQVRNNCGLHSYCVQKRSPTRLTKLQSLGEFEEGTKVLMKRGNSLRLVPVISKLLQKTEFSKTTQNGQITPNWTSLTMHTAVDHLTKAKYRSTQGFVSQSSPGRFSII